MNETATAWRWVRSGLGPTSLVVRRGFVSTLSPGHEEAVRLQDTPCLRAVAGKRDFVTPPGRMPANIVRETRSSSAIRSSWVVLGSKASSPEFRLNHVSPAIRTNAVAEFYVGILADVGLKLLPVIVIVPDFFAITADGQQFLELLHLFRCRFQFANPIRQPRLQFRHDPANPNPRLQLVIIERFGDVIVRAASRPATTSALAVRAVTRMT